MSMSKLHFSITYDDLTLLMAHWVDLEAEKSRTERLSVRDHPTAGWFETTDLSSLTQRVKKNMKETRDFYFLRPPCLPIEPLGGLEIE